MKEHVNRSALVDLFKSKEFVGKVVESVERTRDTGLEHSFSVVKEFRSKPKILPISAETNRGMLGPDFKLTGNTYYLVDFHTHPADYSPFPSTGDIVYLRFLQRLQEASGVEARIIGCVGNEADDGESISLVLFQHKKDADMVDLADLSYQFQDEEEENADRILSDEDVACRYFERQVEELFDPFFNQGMLLLGREKTGYELLDTASSSYMNRQYIKTVDLLSKFKFEAEKNKKI
jgi:hypothetical protein